MSTMTTPRKRAGRPPNIAKKKALNITLSPPIFDALEEFRVSGEFKIERSDVIERALEAYLESKGCWPPKDA